MEEEAVNGSEENAASLLEIKEEIQDIHYDTITDEKCYCGEERCKEKSIVEFQCCDCHRWYHARCTEVNSEKLIPFLTNYEYLCKKCSVDGNERFDLKTARLVQACVTALANLMITKEDIKMFCKEKDIIPFIQEHWHAIFGSRSKSASWHSKLTRVMMKEKQIFKCEQLANDNGKLMVFARLVSEDMFTISPLQFENRLSLMVHSKNYEDSATTGKLGHKRKEVGGRRKGESLHNQSSSKKSRSDLTSSHKELPAHGYPLEHPFNKDGYRYIFAERDPHAITDDVDSDVWMGKKPLPPRIYRAVSSPRVYQSLNDRAHQLKVSDERFSVIGHKGYCVARATHGISEGAWYFEVTVDSLGNGEAATRLGWSQLYGNLQAPLGYDKFSYSWRSSKGTRFHQSRGKSYSDGYGEGDVLGFYIYLPERKKDVLILPETYKDKVLITFKGYYYYEVRDNVTEAEKKLKELSNSKIIFYKNGVNQGVAWNDIYEGTYYPAVSLYKAAQVTVNFGPEFKFPPKDVDYQPISALSVTAAVKQCLADTLFHVEYIVDPKPQEPVYVVNTTNKKDQ